MRTNSHRFPLGPDSAGREHWIDIDIDRGADGTLGVRISGSHAMTCAPEHSSSMYVTTHKPGRMPKVNE